jgi:hypothetical protein
MASCVLVCPLWYRNAQAGVHAKRLPLTTPRIVAVAGLDMACGVTSTWPNLLVYSLELERKVSATSPLPIPL